MNKKCMSKIGTISVVATVATLTIFIFLLLLVSASQEKYILGEKVKIEIGKIGEYKLELQTPTKNLLYKSDESYFVFEPETTGDYLISVESESTSKQITFKVISPEQKKETYSPPEEAYEDGEKNITEEEENKATQIKLGSPVKWEKEIPSGENIEIKIPESSENISIESNSNPIEFEIKNSIIDSISNLASSEKQKTIIFPKVESNTTIKYETPSPTKTEKTISKEKKEIEISSEVHYENILASTSLPKEIPKNKKNSIRIFWKEEEQYLPFKAYDTNNDSLLDEVEWIIPHLSTQNFEIIIITKAKQLDQDRNFIEDIFDKVKALDDIWQTIPENNFIRVVFEKELTSKNDITIYAKSNELDATVEVYEKDSTKKIADFGQIKENKKYQVLLNELNSPQNTFDLLIKGGEISFDYIVDPSWYMIDSDSFEDQDWNTEESRTWSRSTTGGTLDIDNERASDGSYSMRSGNSAYSQQTASLAIDTTGYTNISVSFYYAETGTWESSDCLYFDWTDDGSNWNNELTLCDDFPDQATFALANYTLSSSAGNNPDFEIRFIHDNPTSGNVEELWIDDVKIIGYGNFAPSVSQAILNSSLDLNMTTENLTCSATGSDPDGDSFSYIYNWIRNSTSYATLNLPFSEISNNSYTKDYANDNSVIINGPTFNSTGGQDGKGAYEFDGTGEYISIPGMTSLINGASEITFSAWVKSDETSTDKGILFSNTPDGTDSIFSIRYDAAGASGGGTNLIKIGLDSTGGQQQLESSSGTQTTDWQHLAFTWSSGNQIKLYINGVLNMPTANTGGLSGTITGATQFYLGVGGKDTINTLGWDGLIDDVFVFDKELSQEQISALYNRNYDLIVSNETSVGDVWECEVTPNDGLLEGTTATSNSLTILPYETPVTIGLETIYPPTNTNVYQNEFFNVTLNVTCLTGDCGAINVTLDPIQESFENFESGEGGFSHEIAESGKIDEWHRSSESSHDGTYSFKAGDTGSGDYSTYAYGALITPEYTMEENSTFSFYHYMSTEAGYDGAKLEYRVDSGSWTKVTSFISGGYNDQYQTYSGGPGDWANGEDIWSNNIGSAGSFSYTEADLSGISGDTIQFRFLFGSDSSQTDEGWYVDSANFTTATPGGSKGIIPMNSGTPFYTTTQNPYTTSSLSEGQSETITFNINATGELSSTYEFFAYANQTTSPQISNQTPSWNTTIIENIQPVAISINSPTGTIGDPTPVLNATLTQRQAETFWYNIDGGTNVTICESCTGEITLPMFIDSEGTFQLNLYANNSNGDLTTNTSSFTIDLNNNFFDTYEDNHSILTYAAGVTWQPGNVTYQGSGLTSNYYDFELGELGDDWATYMSSAYARIGARTEESHSGSYSVIADSSIDNQYELSELISTYDFTGTQNFNLNFWYKEEGDENDGGSDHSGHQNADAVYFTCDGNYWYHLMNLYGSSTWQQINIDVASDPDFCSEVNSSFAIKFTQYDNYAYDSDGIMWDDINITYDGFNSEEVESREIHTTDVIAEFTNITWNYAGTGEVKIQVSANNGTSWHNATNNQAFPTITGGNYLKYKIIFEGTGQLNLALLDLNLTWSNTASPPPEITINSPTTGTFPDVTPILNVSLDSTAANLWYKVNGGSRVDICQSCSGEHSLVLYLQEDSYTVTVYADNSIGTTNSKSVSFTIDMNGNYFDTFNDNSQIWSSSGPIWYPGNVTFQDSYIGIIVNETFEDMDDWTPTGGSWEISNGEMEYTSNDGDPGVFSLYDNLEMEQGRGYEISVRAYDDDNDENAVVFRYKDGQNHYKCAYRIQDLGTSEHGLIKIEDGIITTLDTSIITYTEDSYNNYKVTIENNNITCYLNGQVAFTAVDSSWEDGQVGVYSDYHQYVRYDDFTVKSWITNLINFLSYPISLKQDIVEILNVTWNSVVQNTNNISVLVSPDNENTWYEAANGQGLGSTAIGKDLVYKVIFNAADSTALSLLDLNITWTHTASPPPTITVVHPGDPLKDTTPIINTTLSGPAEFYWYTVNDGPQNIICEGCSGQQDVLLLLEEGNYDIDFYTNNSLGAQEHEQILFEVDMQRNYFDTFLDSSQIATSESASLNIGNISYTADGNRGLSDGFESGSLSSDWTTYSSLASGVVDVESYDAHTGVNSVSFYTNAGGTNTLNELITTKDFSGATSVNLTFWFREEQDENTGGADHTGHRNSDSVYFTCNGNYWYHLYDLFGSSSWQEVNIDVSADPNFCSTVTSSFAIKFTQYDNWELGSDGILIDDISIEIPGGEAQVIAHPINVTQNIRRISNITWTELGADSTNKIFVNLSVDGGSTWFPATSGSSIQGFSEGNSLVYDIFFDLKEQATLSLLDLNITWEEPPSINILYPQYNYIYNYEIIKMNYTVSVSGGETLDECWWTNNSGVTNYTITCGNDISTTSTSGVNVWTIYANDSSGSIGSDTVQFIVDTAAPQISFVNQTANPVDEGSEFEINVNVTDSNTDSVWIVIWETVVGGATKFTGYLSNIFGDLFSIGVNIDETYNETYNYTIYANDSSGLISTYNGTFDVLKALFVPDANPIYSDGTNPAFISGLLKLNDETSLANHAINIWFENEIIPFENLTAHGTYLSDLNFTGRGEIFSSSYAENVTWNGTIATLDGTNASGVMSGVLDAGALVEWETLTWDILSGGCSQTTTFYNGNSDGYSSTHDTYIDGTNPTTSYSSEEYLLLDTSPDMQRTLLKFDNIFGYGKGKVPYDSSISSSTMTVEVYDTGNAPTLYEMLEDWTESQATYNGRLAGISWSSTGVTGYPSRSTTPLGTISATTTGSKSLGITNLVRSWNNRSKENYGVVFEPGGSSGIGLRSSEYTTTPTQRPALEVSFTSSACAGIQVEIRTSQNGNTWSDWKEIFIDEEINDSLTRSRYLEYKITFGSYDGIIKPNLYDIYFNYTAITTDISGRYNYSWVTPETFGTYDINLTSGLRTINAKQYLELKVQSGIDPVVEIISPEDNAWLSEADQTLEYNATDQNDDLAYSILFIDGTNVSYNQSPMINGQNDFDYTFSEGIHNWSIQVFDSSGLNDTSPNRTVAIDLTDPTITLNYPPNESTHTVGYLNLSFTPLDNLDHYLTCNVTLDGNEIVENQEYQNNTESSETTPALSNGIHYWNVTCQDESKRTFTSPTRWFNISDTPPTVTLLSPEDDEIVSSQNVNFTFSPDDNSGITICELLVDGEIKGNVTSPELGKNATILATGLSDGFHNWSVICTDLSSTQVNSGNWTIGIDTTGPTIEIFNPQNGYISSISTPNFDIRITDAIDSLPTCDLVVAGSTLDTFNATSGLRFNFTSSIIDDGVSSWYLNCSDDSGHYNSSTPINIDIREAPNVTMNNTNATYQTGNSFTVLYFPTDNTGLDNCKVYLDGALNQTSSSINNGAQNFFDIDYLEDGIHTYYVTCEDTISLTANTSIYQFTIDNQAPTIAPFFPLNEDVYSTNITFNFTATDALSEEINCSILIDNNPRDTNIIFTNATNVSRTISGVSDGTHDWNLTCYDLAGNTGYSSTYNFTRYTAPGIDLISPENATWLNDSNVEFIYYPMDDEGFAKAELFLNGAFDSENTSVTSHANNSFIKSLSDGIYTWYIKVTDLSMMPTNSQTRTVYIDTQAPTINLGWPYQDQLYSTNNVTFNFTVTDNMDSPIACDLYIGSDIEWSGEVTNSSEETANILLTDGNHTYKINCSDEAGNTKYSTETNFTVFAPPKITLLSPPNKTYTQNSSINFSYIPEDALGLIECSIYLDNNLNETSYSIVPNVQNNFTISGISEGHHNWSVQCTDTDTNTNSSTAWTLTRDITPPSIILSSPQDNSGVDANLQATFIWTATDILDSLLTCDLIVDTNIEDTSYATSGFPRTEPVSGLFIGPHTWNVTCSDQAGNLNTSQTWDFNYTYPDFLINETLISISNSNPTENETITINATIYNIGGAGISSVEVKFYNGDPDISGIQIGTTKTISIEAFSSNLTSVEWDAPLGVSNIFVIVDESDSFQELNETNNKANQTLSVQSWHFFYGNINPDTNFTLTDSSNYELTNWNLINLTKGNIYVADSDSIVDWNSLQAIGKKISGTSSTNDIQELDSSLSMTGFKDSHEQLYLNSSSQINETSDYTIFSKPITGVPVANSITSPNFKTGILWDTSDDTTSEYDTTEKEDIVYLTSIQKSTMGSYEVSDYELRVPANLRSYDTTNQQTAVFYIEII